LKNNGQIDQAISTSTQLYSKNKSFKYDNDTWIKSRRALSIGQTEGDDTAIDENNTLKTKIET